MTLDPALISSGILALALVLFVSERVRHDLVALIALFAALAVGIVSPKQALSGFADPAVVAVAAVLVVGRAIELSGVAAAFTRRLIPQDAPFQLRLIIVMVVGAVLSAFMNNIAALVITMPIASQLAIDSKRSPAAALMPLAFATILGGMTTLIGTPANLILSSIREDSLGTPFGFFQMTPVALTVALAGLLYMATIGWRLLPSAQGARRAFSYPWRVFEIFVPQAEIGTKQLRAKLRSEGARILAAFEPEGPVKGDQIDRRVLVLSRKDPWQLAAATGTRAAAVRSDAPDAETIRAVVANGSYLVGQRYDLVNVRSDNRISVVSAGPRAVHEKRPLSTMRIQPGDQLFIHGSAADLGEFATSARLLEIGRHDPSPVERSKAAAILAIFASAIFVTVTFGLSPAITFLAAATLLAGLRLMPAAEVYRSIDWPVILLLAAMIPVGQSFVSTGGAAYVSSFLSEQLIGTSTVFTLVVIGTVTLLLSALLNNVATAIIMGPLVLQMAEVMNFSPDAGLIMVLIAASSDFLTPIGHQNNLLVMGPGGYRFGDYARMGSGLSLIVIGLAAFLLTSMGV